LSRGKKGEELKTGKKIVPVKKDEKKKPEGANNVPYLLKKLTIKKKVGRQTALGREGGT